MSNMHPRRWLILLGALLAGVVVLVAAGMYFATRALKSQVEAALGPRGEVGAISVGISAIEVRDLRIKAAPGWPAAEELSAKRVVVVPDLKALLSRNFRVASIRVEDAYLSMLRRRDGKLLVLPSLVEAAGHPARPGDKAGQELPQIILGGIELDNSAIEFFDATVRQPAHKLRLEKVKAAIGKVVLPQLSGKTGIDLTGSVKGGQRDGTLSIKGWAEIATRDSDLAAQLRGVDLVSFQPYLIKAAETGVRRGILDLDLNTVVRNKRLRAPGSVTLSDLELAGSGNFMGMSRSTFIAALKDRNGRISAKFVLEGQLDDPKFSLNENFAGKIGASLGNVLGISLEGLAKGVGSVGSSAAKGLGETMGKLFGK